MKKIIIIAYLSGMAFGHQLKNYKDARKQNILEYTVFGIDECLKKNEGKFVVNSSDLTSEKILVGSAVYFNFLASCFQDVAKTCTDEDSCIVKESMGKRIENVAFIDEKIQKLSIKE